MFRRLVLLCIGVLTSTATLSLQGSPIRIVYAYDRKYIDSLEIIVNKNEKTIYQKNHTLFTNFDSTNNISYATKADTVEVILRGYKKDLYCFPHIDRLYYPFRISYGLNFECVKLKT
jgi:hypothetical protein